ncbi:MAG: hypothetical protein MJ252_09395 [archaeon]|nr:hypothetical protein [archaeon]
MDSLIQHDQNKYNAQVYNQKKMEYTEKLKEIEKKKVPVAEGGDKKEENKDDPFAKLKEQLSGCVVTEA